MGSCASTSQATEATIVTEKKVKGPTREQSHRHSHSLLEESIGSSLQSRSLSLSDGSNQNAPPRVHTTDSTNDSNSAAKRPESALCSIFLSSDSKEYLFAKNIDLKAIIEARLLEGVTKLHKLKGSAEYKTVLRDSDPDILFATPKKKRKKHGSVASNNSVSSPMEAHSAECKEDHTVWWKVHNVPEGSSRALILRIKEVIDGVLYYILLSGVAKGCPYYHAFSCPVTHRVMFVDEDGATSGADFNIESITSAVSTMLEGCLEKLRAMTGNKEMGADVVAEAVSAGFRFLQHCHARKGGGGGGGDVGDVDSLFHVSSARDALSAVLRNGKLVAPIEGIQSERDTVRRLRSSHDLLSKLGVVFAKNSHGTECSSHQSADWFQFLPTSALNAEVKTDLLFACCSISQRRVPLVNIRRSFLLEDTRGHLSDSIFAFLSPPKRERAKKKATSDLEEPHYFAKIFPSFMDSTGVPEQGEGHGPRKEFFDLCAEAATSAWRRPQLISNKCCATLRTDSSTVVLDFVNESLITEIPKWSKLILRNPNSVEECEREVVDTSVSGSQVSVRLVEPPAFSSPAAIVSVALRCAPLFAKEQDHYWFFKDETLGTTPLRKLSDTQRETLANYACLGWVLGQSIANGVSMNMGLPPLLFAALQSWPKPPIKRVGPAELKDLEVTYSDLYQTVKIIQGLSPQMLKETLQSEGLSTDMSCMQYIERYVQNEVFDSVQNQLNAFYEGFCAVGVCDFAVYKSMLCREQSLAFQGRADDGVSDFEFEKEFLISHPEELRENEHNSIFKKVLWEVLESGFGAADTVEKARRKRSFLKFLTGRSLLSAHAKTEQISVVIPYTIFNAPVFSSSLFRLPVSHTCENTLELPNYMEGLIFGECDEWYERAGKTKGCSVMQSQRAGAWALLSDGAKDHVMQRLRATLMDRFVTAVDNSDSYELDEMESVQITPRLPPKPMDDTTLSNTASVPSARGSRKDDVDTEDDSRQLYSSTNSGGATLPMGGLEGGLGRGGGGGAGGWEQPAKASPPQSYEGRGWDSESEEKPAARLSPRSQFVHINSDNAKEGSEPLLPEEPAAPTSQGDPWDTEDLDELLKNFEGQTG